MYSKLPIWGQHAAVSLKGASVRRKRYGGEYRKSEEGFLERGKWSSDQVHNFREGQRLAALERASHAPYYRSLFKDLGANWTDFEDPKEFTKLPIITKETLVADIDQFRPRPPSPRDEIIRTSGTTGSSLAFPASRNVEPDQWAVWWRYRSWHGIKRGERCGLFASAMVVADDNWSKPCRFDRANNDVRFSIFHISAQSAPTYVNELNSYAPAWLHGNPTAIALLASHMRDQGLRLSYQPKWLTVGSENLLPWQRKAMQEAFGLDPIQHYGLVEGAANISECPHNNLHVDEDYSYVEFVPEGDAGSSAIVGTCFSNTALSLLRYHTGDLARLEDGQCSCGRWGRLVSNLDGRLTDYVVLPGGRKVASLATPFHATDGLAGAQLYQDKKGDLVVRYVLSSNGSLDLGLLEKRLRLRVGSEIKISFEQRSEIPRSARGKSKLVVSDYTQ